MPGMESVSPATVNISVTMGENIRGNKTKYFRLLYSCLMKYALSIFGEMRDKQACAGQTDICAHSLKAPVGV